jgi:hypothetical protein
MGTKIFEEYKDASYDIRRRYNYVLRTNFY